MSTSSSFGSAALALAFVALVVIGAGQSRAATLTTSSSILDKVALNPQPLPPKEKGFSLWLFDRYALNPQPLPPKDGGSAVASGLATRAIMVGGGKY